MTAMVTTTTAAVVLLILVVILSTLVFPALKTCIPHLQHARLFQLSSWSKPH